MLVWGFFEIVVNNLINKPFLFCRPVSLSTWSYMFLLNVQREVSFFLVLNYKFQKLNKLQIYNLYSIIYNQFLT